METDEVFVLPEGEVGPIIGEEMREISLERHTFCNTVTRRNSAVMSEVLRS